jgi:hypothetical protein
MTPPERPSVSIHKYGNSNWGSHAAPWRSLSSAIVEALPAITYSSAGDHQNFRRLALFGVETTGATSASNSALRHTRVASIGGPRYPRHAFQTDLYFHQGCSPHVHA